MIRQKIKESMPNKTKNRITRRSRSMGCSFDANILKTAYSVDSRVFNIQISASNKECIGKREETMIFLHL